MISFDYKAAISMCRLQRSFAPRWACLFSGAPVGVPTNRPLARDPNLSLVRIAVLLMC